ncbi:unnamed protein product [Ilex paraguariensis]|uniref:Uncharacterized protein n=1 Tax=Ilex paraguariensis TaxID=185542 RepID=A0ABC8SK61_9AQUA
MSFLRCSTLPATLGASKTLECRRNTCVLLRRKSCHDSDAVRENKERGCTLLCVSCEVRSEMHAYNRLPSSGHSSPSSPQSPLRSPRLRHGKSKVGRFTPGPAPKTLAQRLAWVLLSVLLRRQGIFLFAPLLYISGMLFYMGTMSFDVVPIISHRPAPGSLYRSPQVYSKLRPEMDSDNLSADAVSDLILFSSNICNRSKKLFNYLLWFL